MIIEFVLIFINIIFFITYKSLKKKNSKYYKTFKFMFFLFFIVTFLEFTLFNYRFYESINYNEISYTDYVLGDGLKLNEDGSLSIVNNKNNYIEINDINIHIDNIYVDFNSEDTNVLTVSFGYTDEANNKYAKTEEVKIQQKVNKALRIHLAGNSEKIRIYVMPLNKNNTFNINQITFNKPIDFTITLFRPFILFAIIMLFYFFRPNSFIYKTKLFDKKAKKIINKVLIIQIFVLILVSFSNSYFVREDFPTEQRYQYQMLAESLLNGHTYLEEEPSEILQSLDNPYDKSTRNSAFKDSDEYYIWDAAYFNGKYYVYFGVAPVIFYYLPFYALTHHHLKTSTCIIITMIITIIGIFSLLKSICKKWFKNVSLGNYLLLSVLFVNCCGILFIMGRPDHYCLPIFMGIMFSIWGLYFWLKAKEKDKKLYLALGSLFMALVSACRPQLLLTSFLAIPIFKDEIKNWFNKKGIKKIIAFVLPYLIIASLLMFYNYIRFGSVFDFGANYNLTTNDMTKRGFVFDRIFLGLYYYLLNPITIHLQFPFVMRTQVYTSYLGTTIYESMGAGFIFVNILTIFAFGIFKFKNYFKDKTPYYIAILSVIFTLIIIIADTEMAGILPRYICDFGFLLYLATCIVLFAILNKNNSSYKKLLFIAFIIGIIYNFLLIFSDENIVNSIVFFYLRNLIQFWL